MDDTQKYTYRTVTTIPETFANTGGLMTTAILIAYGVVRYFQDTIYYSTLTKCFYQYEPEEMNEDLEDEEDVVPKSIFKNDGFVTKMEGDGEVKKTLSE